MLHLVAVKGRFRSFEEVAERLENLLREASREPHVFVLSEDAIGTRAFRRPKTKEGIRLVQRALAGHPNAHLAFAVPERMPHSVSNSGYLVSKDAYRAYAKKELAHGDGHFVARESGLDEGEEKILLDWWERRAHRERFPAVPIRGTDKNVELRVCRDLLQDSSFNDVVVAPSSGLGEQPIEMKALHRGNVVLVNDDAMRGPAVWLNGKRFLLKSGNVPRVWARRLEERGVNVSVADAAERTAHGKKRGKIEREG